MARLREALVILLVWTTPVIADEWSTALKLGSMDSDPDSAKAKDPLDVWARVHVPKAEETTCLRRQKHGCSEIKNRGICLNSRDGRSKEEANYTDIDVYDSPCVWCGESQCTGNSDSLCEPLEYLRRGAPKYFPSFLAPGSFSVASCEDIVPLPALNYSCLLWATEGCHVIKDQNKCLRSLEGRKNNEYLGASVFKDPCVWCGGGVCTEVDDAKCLPFGFLMNGKGSLYDFWHTPEFSTFAACDGAHFRAARLGPGPAYKATFVEEVKQCDGINFQGKKECPRGFTCVKRGVNSYCENTIPQPGYFITAGKQVWWHDRMKNEKHLVPPGINCGKCGCQGNMTMVSQDIINAIPTGRVFDNCDKLMSAEGLETVPNKTAGLFISVGKQVWWHSPQDEQKHLVEPGIDCSRCGCSGKISLVGQSTLDAVEIGDPFNCSMYDAAQHHQAPVPGDGRFISTGKQVWWQSPADGLKHLVEPGIDCSNCGCKEKIEFVDQTALDTLQTGEDFDCTLFREAMDDLGGDLGAGSGLLQVEAKSSIGPASFVLPLLAVLGSSALCWAGLSSQQLFGDSKFCRNRGVELSSDESADEEGELPAAMKEALVSEPEPASPSSLPASPVGSSLASPVASSIRVVPTGVSFSNVVLRPTTVLCPAVPTQVSYTSFASAGSPHSLGSPAVAQTTTAARGVDVEQPADVFDQIDRDHDGQITREEWRRYAFEAFDQNHDGQVSSEEFRQARTQA